MHRRLLALALCATVASPVLAQAIYKITDPDGKVRYTDTRPENPGAARVETIQPPPPGQNILQPDASMQQWTREKIGSEREAAANALSAWEAEYAAARSRLDAAEAALAAGKEPQEGDFTGIAGRFGGSAGAQPSEEFLQRLEALETEAREARTALDAVAARKPNLSNY